MSQRESDAVFEFEGSRGEFLKILAEMGEEPAFVARARATESALAVLLKRCEKQQDELLIWPRRHFTVLRQRIAGDWSRLSTFVNQPHPSRVFERLHERLPPIDEAWSKFVLTDRAAIKAFIQSATRFNQAWSRFLDSDLIEPVNRQRREYNEYFPIEKACAFGSDVLAGNFDPLPMIERSYLESKFPFLELPSLRR